MRIAIGIDEAGYGPSMGPLVIAASIWSVDPSLEMDGALAKLAPEFRAAPWQTNDDFLPLGDSKKVYRPGLSLDGLQAGVSFLLRQCRSEPSSLSDLLRCVASNDADRVECQPWYAPHLDLPIVSDVASRAAIKSGIKSAIKSGIESRIKSEIECAPQYRECAKKLASLGLQFLGFRARVIEECEFNRVVSHAGNKANALSEWSIGLLRDCIQEFGSPVHALSEACVFEGYCDRHGGRKRYAPVLTHAFNGHADWFEILEETPRRSVYQTQLPLGALRVQFVVGGDSIVPAAASSMLAKWIREQLMGRLNRFWSERVGEALRPTAGYAVDAARFYAEIVAHAERLGHPNESWWRSR